VAFYGCAFIGWQDTLFAASTNTILKNTYIEGAVDFIYGGANSNLWFENCEIGFSRANGGYITASGRNSDDAAWYIINNSTVKEKSGVAVAAGKVWLGRPWRAYARVVYQHTYLSNIIHPEGWNPWDKGNDLSNIYYGEYANSGAGSDTSKRVSWSKQLSNPVTIDSVMPEWKDWVNQSYWAV
jgi:pectinesterase